MSLTLKNAPQNKIITNIKDLKPGTWFTDSENQIYVIIHDDRSDEDRILCAGDFYQPFIVNIPIKGFKINRVLEAGTLLEVTRPIILGASS